MKKLMFLLAAASLSSVAFAQQKSNSQNVLVGESVDVMEVPVDKYKVETNHFFDNWFFSVGGGAQVLFGDQSDLGKFKKRIAPALQISIGKWFTPGLGLRLQYSGLQSKSFSSEPSAYSKPHMLSEGYYQDKFNYMNLHGDILFNVSNMIAGYNEDRIYDFVPFVGFGFAHSYDAPRRNSLAFNFGIINTFHLASAWDLNLELYGMGTENKFDGKTTSKGPDFMAGATVGITYKFPQRGFKPAPDVDAIMALTSSQMDAINTALAQQIEQNRQLKAQLANQPTEVVTEQVTVNQIAPAPQSVFFQIGSAVAPPAPRCGDGETAAPRRGDTGPSAPARAFWPHKPYPPESGGRCGPGGPGSGGCGRCAVCRQPDCGRALQPRPCIRSDCTCRPRAHSGR